MALKNFSTALVKGKIPRRKRLEEFGSLIKKEFADPFALQNPLTDDREGTKVTELIVHITSARGPVKLKEIAIY